MTMTAATWCLGRRRQAYLLVALAAIWFYVLVSGFPVSALRRASWARYFLPLWLWADLGVFSRLWR
ncbi:MAG: hypothetical protein VCB79_13610, partial [Dehalococcoidia bacterium]